MSAFDLGAEATGAALIGGHALFALGSGAVRVADGPSFDMHDGPILAITPHSDGKRLLTGGEDGKLKAVTPSGEVSELASFGSKWVGHLVANRNSGVVVAGVGKEVVVFKDDVESHRFAHPSSIGGLALDAKGRRLAASHYGGATLRYALAQDDSGVPLEWAGSHLAVTISPDADYVLTAMQELELHGWKLPEKQDLRMSGYSAKTRSFSWDRRGRWLATSGADCAVLWPFQGKAGPMNKSPSMLGRRDALVTRVAFHPRDEMLAIGYADGLALMADLETGDVREIAARTEAPVSALVWSEDGRRIAIADESGRALVVDV